MSDKLFTTVLEAVSKHLHKGRMDLIDNNENYESELKNTLEELYHVAKQVELEINVSETKFVTS